MNPLWTRIGLGATVIFGVGLAGIAAVNKGKAEIGQFLGRAGSRIPLRLAHLDFDLEGRRIGAIKSVVVRHDAQGTPGTVNVEVALADGGSPAGLSDCNLTAGYDGNWSGSEGFRCAASTELGEMVRMGTVRFTPVELERPLYVPAGIVDRWQRSGVRALEASLITDGSGGVTAKGRFDVIDRRHRIERGSFSLRANDAGAELSVLDHLGRALLDIRAGENGVHVNVSDLDGKRLLRLIEELKN